MDFKDTVPFQKKYLDEEGKAKDVITVWLNPEERKILEEVKNLLEQEKDSTAYKQMALIGYKTISEPKIRLILEVIFANKRKNKRLGIGTFET